MNDNDGFPHEHDETAERHADTWVAGSGSVAAPGDEETDTESSEGATGWGHGVEHTSEAGETDGGRAWDAPAGEAGTSEAGAFGEHESGTTGEHESGTTGEHESGGFGDHESAGGFGGHDAGETDLTAHDTDAEHDTDTADGTSADPVAEHDDALAGHDDTVTGHDETVPEHDAGTDPALATDTTAATDTGATDVTDVAATGNGAPPAPDGGEQIEHLIDPAESDRFHAAWRDIQSSFVDDPRDAVHQASTLAEEVLNALSTALKARVQAVEEGWQGGDGAADTERLRIALRGYRALLDQVLAG